MELAIVLSQQEAAQLQPRLAAQQRGLHVLLVEDDAADAHLIMSALSQQGAKVAHIELAHDGVEALERLDESVAAPDLAIVDLQMPRMNGFKLLIEMACRGHGGIPIVILTSSAAKNDAVRSLFRGARQVITKPHSFDELKRILSATIDEV
jgi:CheY-like chemotaxis protein